MTEIHITNVVAQVLGADARQHSMLDAALRYREEGYIFAPTYKAGTWDGYQRLYNTPTHERQFGKFPTGCLHRAVLALGEAGYQVGIIDDREVPQPQEPIPVSLREDRYYQADAVEACVQRTRGIVRVATAGGKNPIAARVLGHLNQPSLFIAHTINLVKQSRTTFKEALGVPIGIIQAGNRDLQRFNVATVQTLASILWSAAGDEVRRFVEEECRVVIVDEAHHASSPSYQRVLGHFLRSYYRFGLSATPHKREASVASKDMRTEGAFGRVIYAKDRAELQEEKYLARAHVFFV
jgi:superfamily II DNA or RNA helicase